MVALLFLVKLVKLILLKNIIYLNELLVELTKLIFLDPNRCIFLRFFFLQTLFITINNL